MIQNYLKIILAILVMSFMACSEPNASNTATTNQPTEQPQNEPEATSDQPMYEVAITPIKTKEDLEVVYGEYWNRMNMKEVKDGDEYIEISASTEKEAWANLYFEGYVASVNNADEVEVNARISCSGDLLFQKEGFFNLSTEDDFCLNGNKTKIYFIQEGDAQGLSFDGKTFDFYKK
ncbi:MAG: hypothetical protein GY810_31210 [Aureispira sp.]|nr:hypothetical protein [Aureispira sp.]